MKYIFKDHLTDVFKSFNQVFWAIFTAKPFPKFTWNTADSKFCTITAAQFDSVMLDARNEMVDDGILYPNTYIKRAFDCENFAMAMKSRFDFLFADRYGKEGLGIPTRLFPYTKDSGGGHVCFAANIEGKERHFEVYPQDQYFKELHLSEREKKTYEPMSMG
jgi:hypothetical protein